MDWPLASGIFCALGTVIGAVCLVLYLRDRRRVEVRYQLFNDTLIGGEAKPLPDGITIRYKGESLDSLRKCSFIVWNRGTDSLRRERVATPITLHLPKDTTAFSCVFAKEPKAANEVTMDYPRKDTVTFDFKYLGVNQGFAVEIVYTCNEGFPTLSATLVDSAEGLIDNGDARPKAFLRRVFTVTNVACVVLVAVMVMAGVRLHDTAEHMSPVLLFGASALLPIIILLLAMQSRRNSDGKPIPEELRSTAWFEAQVAKEKAYRGM